MNNIQTACFAMLASAFLLAGILVVRIDQKSQANTAQADQVITQTGFTLMTAVTRGGEGGEESLFILDSGRGVLIVYTPSISNKRLEPTAAIKMSDIF